MERAAIYARVSSDGQAEKGFSLQTQLDECQNYAAEHGYHVSPDLVFVESYTSTVLERPQMDKLLDRAEAGAIDVLVLYCMDRLSRGGRGHQWFLEEEFNRHGVRLEYATEHYEDSAEGEFQKEIHAAVAQYERAKLIERITRGRRGRARAGLFLPGGAGRYGYRYVRKSPSDPGHVEIDNDEAEVVRLVFRLYLIGDESGRKLGTRSIARRLSDMKVPTRFDKAPGRQKKKRESGVWGWTTIANMLAYEGYCGVHWLNRSRFVKDEQTKKQKQIPRDKSEWIAVKIDPIIDRETWEAAQARTQHNKRNKRREATYEYLMRSRLKCTCCGSTFLVETSTRPKTPRQYYYCLGQRSYYSADGKTLQCTRMLKAEIVDAVIWDYVRSVLREPEKIMQAFRHEQNEAKVGVANIKRQLASIERKIASNREKHKFLLDEFIDKSAITRDALETKAAQLNSMNQELEYDAKNLRAQLERRAVTDAKITSALEWCVKAREGIDDFTFEDRLMVINLLNVTAIVERGATQDDDVITVSGFLPMERLENIGLSYNAIYSGGHKDDAIPFTHVIRLSKLA